MPIGNTTTDALTDSLPYVIASARQVREQEGVMSQLVDKVTLGEGDGLDWTEITLDKLTAQAVTEQTDLQNAQQINDTKFQITPTVTGLLTIITDRVAARISKKAYQKIGSLGQNAIQRKKDQDGLVVLDGATTSLGGAGTTLTSGVLAAGVTRITSNTVEPGNLPVHIVLHGFQIKDIWDEITAPVGTYSLNGESARVFKEGTVGMVAKARVFEDGNIAIDGADDAKGGVFAKEAIVLVQGRGLRMPTERKENIGGGATAMYHYDEYAYGERSAGHWLYEIYSDATAPTS